MNTPNATERKHVLLIEDDSAARKLLRMALVVHAFRVSEAHNGALGLAQALAQPPDLIILDMGLPDMDGLTITRRLREWTMVPIIILSGQRSEADKVAALDAGADDYVTKPYGVEELLARVRVALRHGNRDVTVTSEPTFTVGDLEVDMTSRQVAVGGKKILLTPTEYALLHALVRRAGTVIPHQQLLREVWGANFARQYTYVRVYVKRLRRKIEADPAQPRYLLSEPGIGYWITKELTETS